MVHTLELSRMLDEEMFETLLKSIKGLRFNKCAWVTQKYADKGISMICLYKFKPKRKNEYGELVISDSEPTLYMISLTINSGIMFGGDGFYSNNTLIFTPDFAKAIYQKIFEQIPELEIHPELKVEGDKLYLKTGKYPAILEDYDFINAFKLRRIDYALDISTTSQQYMKLLSMGKGIQRKSYTKKVFEDTSKFDKIIEDDEPDVEELDELLEEYESDIKYVYYKSKSVNINAYLKGEQLKKAGIIDSDDDSYNFFRIEIQAKKGKLNTLNRKYGIKGRDFHKMLISEYEPEILKYYINLLSGTGLHITYDNALKLIDCSMFRPSKKEKLKKLLSFIVKYDGIRNVLNMVENGTITEFGEKSTVDTYIREIQKIGINPVTIPSDMVKVTPEVKFISPIDDDVLSEVMMLSLVDIVNLYNQMVEEERLYGPQLTGEDFEQIDKL